LLEEALHFTSITADKVSLPDQAARLAESTHQAPLAETSPLAKSAALLAAKKAAAASAKKAAARSRGPGK
jgi:hypothetical protein